MSHGVPTLESQLRRFNVVRVLNWVVLVPLLAADCAFAVALVRARTHTAATLACVAGALLLAFGVVLLRAVYRQTRLSDVADDEKLGRYTAREVKAVVSSMLEPYRDREVPTVYLVATDSANAEAIDSLLMNFIKPLNAVYLHRKVFSILQVEELRALMAHELGHFYHYMHPADRFGTPFIALLALLPPYIAQVLGLNRALTLVAFVLVAQLGGQLRRLLADHTGKATEYLADWHAAKACGTLACTNMLLTLGKHAEMHSAITAEILKRIKADNTLPASSTQAVAKAVFDNLPDPIVTHDRLVSTIDRVMQSPELKELHRTMSRSEIRQEEETIDAYLNRFFETADYRLIDWDAFDFDERDSRVNEREYPYLIQTLREDPEGQLFSMVSDHEGRSRRMTHPTTRQRILFLDECGV